MTDLSSFVQALGSSEHKFSLQPLSTDLKYQHDKTGCFIGWFCPLGRQNSKVDIYDLRLFLVTQHQVYKVPVSMNSLHKSHTVLDSLVRLCLLVLQARSSDESVLFMIDTNHQLISLCIFSVGYALFLSYYRVCEPD